MKNCKYATGGISKFNVSKYIKPLIKSLLATTVCYSQCSISCTFSTCKFHLCVVLNLHTYLLFTYTLLKILHILHFYLCIFRGIWEIVWKCKTLKYLKFKFSEKATKIEKIFAINLTMCSNRQIDGEDFINFFGLLRKHKLFTLLT